MLTRRELLKSTAAVAVASTLPLQALSGKGWEGTFYYLKGVPVALFGNRLPGFIWFSSENYLIRGEYCGFNLDEVKNEFGQDYFANIIVAPSVVPPEPIQELFSTDGEFEFVFNIYVEATSDKLMPLVDRMWSNSRNGMVVV